MSTNYKNGKIYKIEPIVEFDEGDVYIGSTTKQYLSERMAKHRYNYNRYKNGKNENKIMSFDLFEKYGIENCDIVLIESVDANSKDELHMIEARYIKMMKCINRNIPMRTNKQYREDNKEKIQQYQHDNKEKKKQYRQDNKEKIKEKMEVYREINKDILIKKMALYRETNRDKLNEKKKEKILCQCGSLVSQTNKARHEKSPKHIEFILNV